MAIHDDTEQTTVPTHVAKTKPTDRSVTLSGEMGTDYDPSGKGTPSMTDGVHATVAKRTMLEDSGLPQQRKHLTGTWARLAIDLNVRQPGMVGEVFYGARGTRVQLMQYDPSRKRQYGIRRVSADPELNENFWRHTVAEDELLCEYSIALANGYVGSREAFNQGVKKGTIDPTIHPTPPAPPAVVV